MKEGRINSQGRLAWSVKVRAGQVLVITLLAIAVLAGLVFYVLNVGEQLNRRINLQNAADSAAISGAGWMNYLVKIMYLD